VRRCRQTGGFVSRIAISKDPDPGIAKRKKKNFCKNKETMAKDLYIFLFIK
jgi:hypothetical protein